MLTTKDAALRRSNKRVREQRKKTVASMSLAKPIKEEDHARQQAAAQLSSVKELVKAWNDAGDKENDNLQEQAEQTIHEDALSVEVRTDWFSPGANDISAQPCEFKILLCTGGPAVQIIGDLDDHNQPEKCRLQYCDWFVH